MASNVCSSSLASPSFSQPINAEYRVHIGVITFHLLTSPVAQVYFTRSFLSTRRRKFVCEVMTVSYFLLFVTVLVCSVLSSHRATFPSCSLRKTRDTKFVHGKSGVKSTNFLYNAVESLKHLRFLIPVVQSEMLIATVTQMSASIVRYCS
jgi:hypothetical protein